MLEKGHDVGPDVVVERFVRDASVELEAGRSRLVAADVGVAMLDAEEEGDADGEAGRRQAAAADGVRSSQWTRAARAA